MMPRALCIDGPLRGQFIESKYREYVVKQGMPQLIHESGICIGVERDDRPEAVYRIEGYEVYMTDIYLKFWVSDPKAYRDSNPFEAMYNMLSEIDEKENM